MARLIYAEPDEEITNLVDRLRSEKDDNDLVFVLPASSRVLQSALNARLLMQYSNSLGKVTSIVSPDARTQGTAIESGFTVYPTLTDYEARRAIDRAVAPVAPVVPALDDLAPLDEVVPPGAAASLSTAPADIATPKPRPAATRTPAVAGGRRSRLPWILGGVGVVLIGLILLFFVLPSATLTIITAARSVSATPTVTGATAAPSGGSGDQLSIQTTLQQAQESMSQGRQATGQKQVPAVQATGQVVFHNSGSVASFDVPPNSEVYTDDGKKFVTTQDSGAIGPGKDSGLVNIQARVGGAAGNVGPGSIKHITSSDPAVQADLTVNNSNPTQNGADATTKTVVSQTDLDQAKKDIGDQLTKKVQDDLKNKAGSQVLIAETQNVTVDANYDHKAGDEAGNFNANITVKGQQTSFDENKMKQVLTDALKRQAPSGYTLTDDAPKLDYRIVQHDNNTGAMTWEATASGFMAVAVDIEGLKKNITGQSAAKARSYVLGHIDASDVIIHQSPNFIPWLPFISGRIDIHEQVQNNTPK